MYGFFDPPCTMPYHHASKLIGAVQQWRGAPQPRTPTEYAGGEPGQLTHIYDPTGEEVKVPTERPKQWKPSAKDKQRWNDLNEQGMSVTDIARQEGVHRYTVDQAIGKKKVGISVPITSQYDNIETAAKDVGMKGSEFRRRLILLALNDLEPYAPAKAAAARPTIEPPSPMLVRKWVDLWLDKGLEAWQIAEHSKYPEDMVRRYLRQNPAIQKDMDERDKLVSKSLQKWLRMREEGASPKQIARQEGLDPQFVSRLLNRYKPGGKPRRKALRIDRALHARIKGFLEKRKSQFGSEMRALEMLIEHGFALFRRKPSLLAAP